MEIKPLIRNIPDFPKPGIVFRDITTLLGNPQGLQTCVDKLSVYFGESEIDYVVGIESRGFIFGTPLACSLGAGFVPVRKPGKLPFQTLSRDYALEYGTDSLEMHADAFPKGSRVAIIDDLIATGGTAIATAELVQEAGGVLCGFGFAIELTFLNGRSRLPDGVPVHSLVSYDQE